MGAKHNTLQVYVLEPRGFCAGVDRAIQCVERALEKFGPPIYVRHEIVHNQHVVASLHARGVVFVEDAELQDIPRDRPLIFSAHGTSKDVHTRVKSMGFLRLFDAVCPLVSRIHSNMKARRDSFVVFIGHAGHPEVEATLSHASDKGSFLIQEVADVAKVPRHEKMVYMTQTTLSVDDTRDILVALKERFPHIVSPPGSDICYATQHRQEAVKRAVQMVDRLVVLGSENSSNSLRLVEVAKKAGLHSMLLSDVEDFQDDFLRGCTSLGITSGASAPEWLVEALLQRISESYTVERRDFRSHVTENVIFRLPAELR